MTSQNAEIGLPLRRILPWTLVTSLAIHAGFYGWLGALPAHAAERPHRAPVEFRVVQTKTQPAPAPPKPERPKPEPPKPPPRPAAPARPAAPPPPQSPPAPLPGVEPPPLAASGGVTLAGDATSAFAMPLASGGALDPTRATTVPAPHVAPRPAPTPTPLAVHEPELVPLADLSARPSPPALGDALERNYPREARQRGLSGHAKVRARVDPDGVVRKVTLVEESDSGFGTACSRTLAGSRWAAPKDKAGRPVATEIRYTCRFVVGP